MHDPHQGPPAPGSAPPPQGHPGHGAWGHGPSGHAAWGHPPAGQAYGHGYGTPSHVNPGSKELEDQGLMWLIVGAAGFWFGAGLITGPLAWVFGNKLRARYRAMGMAPHGNATGAWIVGIATTLVSLLGFLAIIALFIVVGFAF